MHFPRLFADLYPAGTSAIFLALLAASGCTVDTGVTPTCPSGDPACDESGESGSGGDGDVLAGTGGTPPATGGAGPLPPATGGVVEGGTGGSVVTTTGGTGTGGDGTGGDPVTPSGTVVMDVTFENRSTGAYSQDMVTEDFGGAPPWNNGLNEGRGNIVEEDGGKFLRIDYPQGAVGPNDGGAQFNVPLNGSYDELYASYRVRFAAGFDFVLGGKLPGLCGGSCKTGGGGAPDDGFSARGMWRNDGAAVNYMYYLEQSDHWGDDFDWDIGGTQSFSSGVWHTVIHRIVMNTPGAADGVVEAWLDGMQVLSRTDVRFRNDTSFGIDSFYFSTFFGGNTSDWAATKAETIDFDSFVISTGPIL